MAGSAEDSCWRQDCLNRLWSGDESARSEILAFAAVRFRKLARFMLDGYVKLRRWVDTDDVLNAALLRLSHAIATIRPASAQHFHRLMALQMRRELRDLARHYYREAGPGPHEEEFLQIPDASQPAEAYVAAASSCHPVNLLDWSEFHTQIEELPEKQKQVFELLYYEGLTQSEAAELLEVSKETVKFRWRRALNTLGNRMRRTTE